MLTQNSKHITRNSIDYHCHLLPGIDDGSADLAESLEMAAILASAGFRDVCCTPHFIRGAFDNSREKVISAVNALQKALDDAKIAVRLRPAAEYYLDEYLLASAEAPLTLTDTGAILVEAPSQAEAAMVNNLLNMVASRGLLPLIAHPERCRAFSGLFDKPRAARWQLFNLFKTTADQGLKTSPAEPAADPFLTLLRTAGCRFQGNIGSFAGVYGDQVRRQAITFLENGLYSCLGSDAHRAAHLEQILRRGMQTVSDRVGEERLGELLSGKALQVRGKILPTKNIH